MTEGSNPTTANDVIAMSQSCSKCGTTVKNASVDIKHPLEFLQSLREQGWYIPDTMPSTTQQARRAHMCPKCASSS